MFVRSAAILSLLLVATSAVADEAPRTLSVSGAGETVATAELVFEPLRVRFGRAVLLERLVGSSGVAVVESFEDDVDWATARPPSTAASAPNTNMPTIGRLRHLMLGIILQPRMHRCAPVLC